MPTVPASRGLDWQNDGKVADGAEGDVFLVAVENVTVVGFFGRTLQRIRIRPISGSVMAKAPTSEAIHCTRHVLLFCMCRT